jgi:hypothetical protein
MLHFHINGTPVAAHSEARAIEAYRQVTGDMEPFLLITTAQRREPETQASQPMGFAISPNTGRMTAVS